MSRTYRNKSDGSVGSDGKYRYSNPRYRRGSRKKPHHIIARGIRREEVDVRRFGETIVHSALIEARLEAEAKEQREHQDE